MMLQIIISLVLLLLTNNPIADEIRPGYMELSEESPSTFSVLWKVPQKSSQKLSLTPRFPDGCTNKTSATSQLINGAILQRWYIHCTDNIVGQRISIEDITNSNTDVLLRLKWLDGSVSTSLLKPSKGLLIIKMEFKLKLTYL